MDLASKSLASLVLTSVALRISSGIALLSDVIGKLCDYLFVLVFFIVLLANPRCPVTSRRRSLFESTNRIVFPPLLPDSDCADITARLFLLKSTGLILLLTNTTFLVFIFLFCCFFNHSVPFDLVSSPCAVASIPVSLLCLSLVLFVVYFSKSSPILLALPSLKKKKKTSHKQRFNSARRCR